MLTLSPLNARAAEWFSRHRQMASLSALVSPVPENRFMFGILAASASYIAVPAAMRIANPKANPGIYLPMSLAITFPVNITIGMPLYWAVANW